MGSAVGEILPVTNDTVAVAVDDGAVEVWRLAVDVKEPLHVLRRHVDAVLRMMYVESDGLLVTASCDCMVCVWDVATGACVAALDGHTREVLWLAQQQLPGPHPQHCSGAVLLSAGLDGHVCVWGMDDVTEGVSDPLVRVHACGLWAVLCPPPSG